MQRIELDFIRRAPRSRWAGRVLLAVSLGIAGDMVFSYTQLSTAVKANEAVVARAAHPRKAVQGVSNDELAAARDTVDRLGLPWPRLFAALEAAASDRVALLAIEPDTKSGTVKISGDSKDYLAALTYVLNLSQAEGLSSVQLVRHETRQGSVGFTVSASWEGARS